MTTSMTMLRRLVEVEVRHLIRPPPRLFIIFLLLLKTVAYVQPFRFHLAPPSTSTIHKHPGRTALFSPLPSSARGGDDGDESTAEEESPYDITLNLFPEDRKRRGRRESSSSFADGERSEMNDRPPPSTSPASSASTVAVAPTTTTTSTTATNTAKRKVAGGTEDRASALYQKIISQRRKQSSTTQTKSTKIMGGNETSAAYYYDITQSSFPEKDQRRRKSSSFKPEQLSEMNDRNPRWNKAPPPQPPTTRSDREETRLDITSVFPNDRPSLLVNTGTKKEWTTSGSYSDSKSQGSDEGGTSKHTASSLSPPTSPFGRNNVEDDDGASFDITQQHYGSDRASFSLHVNSGMMERRGTHSGQVTPRSYVESYRNIAHNFSSNRASLMGHPPPRKVVRGGGGGSGSRSGGGEFGDGEVYLDRHQFSSNVSPASVATSAATPSTSSSTSSSSSSKTVSKTATNAMWRKGDPITSPSFSSPKKNDEICLDTPRAFVKNLDMIASTKRVPTEADKYLDSNSFSWNIDSTKRKLPIGSTPQRSSSQPQQPYLDKPRPFQSNVDMVSSNFSGAKFKRSSDIPPELKNIKDYYDISTTASAAVTGPMSSTVVEGAATTGDTDPVVDITRSRFSATLERTSSIIRDGSNMAASRAWIQEKQFNAGNHGNGVDVIASSTLPSEQVDGELGDDEDDENFEQSSSSSSSSSFDEVMYWLLTHLPNLQEEDAISYFHYLLEDGFDTVDILQELLEEDLYFMKKGHRRAMMRSVRSGEHSSSSGVDVSREEDDGNGVIAVTDNDTVQSVAKISQIRDGLESEESKTADLEAVEEVTVVAKSERASGQAEIEEESTVDDSIEDI